MKPIIYFTLLIILSSCNPDKDKVKKSETSNTEIDVSEIALEYGDIISKETKKILGSNLIKAVDEGGVSYAIEFCNLKAYPLVDSLEKKFNARIKRASHRSRNPNDIPTDHEAKIIAEYQIMLDEGKVGDPKVDYIDDNTLIYIKPIILDNQVCLNCHGIPGDQILQENLDLIKKLYPEDNAVGFNIGELRGIWSITFKKDQLLESNRSN
ncbi:DUF3365 domain-containing protein [Bacteroidota bacterium]